MSPPSVSGSGWGLSEPRSKPSPADTPEVLFVNSSLPLWTFCMEAAPHLFPLPALHSLLAEARHGKEGASPQCTFGPAAPLSSLPSQGGRFPLPHHTGDWKPIPPWFLQALFPLSILKVVHLSFGHPTNMYRAPARLSLCALDTNETSVGPTHLRTWQGMRVKE